METFSGADEGEEGHEAWEGNSFMVTVTRLVVTSVTTTSLQLGAISGCQSGSPSAGTLWGSAAAAELWSPGATEDRAVDGWHFGWRWLRFFLAPSGDERSGTTSSSSSSKEEEAEPEGEEREGDEGRKEVADTAGLASEDGEGPHGLVVWPFWVCV